MLLFLILNSNKKQFHIGGLLSTGFVFLTLLFLFFFHLFLLVAG